MKYTFRRVLQKKDRREWKVSNSYVRSLILGSSSFIVFLEYFFLFINPFCLFISYFYCLFPSFFLVFYCPSSSSLLFHLYFILPLFFLLGVSSLAYPNLLGTKMIGCCCCCYMKSDGLSQCRTMSWNLYEINSAITWFRRIWMVNIWHDMESKCTVFLFKRCPQLKDKHLKAHLNLVLVTLLHRSVLVTCTTCYYNRQLARQ
jgi:hypothetical protein